MNNKLDLDVWHKTAIYGKEITHIMYHLFDEYCEDSVGPTSVKVKWVDGAESKWYHPPKEGQATTDSKYLWQYY